MSLWSPSGIPLLVLLQCSTDSRVRWSMEQQSVINKEEKHHEDWRWDHGSSRRPPTEEKDKEEKKVCFSQLQFLTGLTLEPLSHQFPNIQFYWPITQQNMTWSMTWKFSAGCIDQIYKQNTTVSCSEFTAYEVMFKTITELMFEHRRKKPNWYKRVKMFSAQLINNLPYN